MGHGSTVVEGVIELQEKYQLFISFQYACSWPWHRCNNTGVFKNLTLSMIIMSTCIARCVWKDLTVPIYPVIIYVLYLFIPSILILTVSLCHCVTLFQRERFVLHDHDHDFDGDRTYSLIRWCKSRYRSTAINARANLPLLGF